VPDDVESEREPSADDFGARQLRLQLGASFVGVNLGGRHGLVAHPVGHFVDVGAGGGNVPGGRT